MKIYLDDERNLPLGYEDWTLIRCPIVAKDLILGNIFNTDIVQTISFDHDLGENTLTGYDVLCAIERRCFDDETWHPPHILIHTANVGARTKMMQAANVVNAIRSRRLDGRETGATLGADATGE